MQRMTTREPDDSMIEVAVAAMKPPEGMKLEITFDQSKYIRRSIEDVQVSLWLGAVLAILIIFVFLRSVRSTLISAVALPTSVIATFAFIQIFGFTLNDARTQRAQHTNFLGTLDDAN